MKSRPYLGLLVNEYVLFKNDKKLNKTEINFGTGDIVEIKYENGVLTFKCKEIEQIPYKDVPNELYLAASITNKDDCLEVISLENL